MNINNIAALSNTALYDLHSLKNFKERFRYHEKKFFQSVGYLTKNPDKKVIFSKYIIHKRSRYEHMRNNCWKYFQFRCSGCVYELEGDLNYSMSIGLTYKNEHFGLQSVVPLLQSYRSLVHNDRNEVPASEDEDRKL